MLARPLATAGVRRDVLMELTALVQHELVRRSESLSSAWIEEAAEDLSTGRLTGWYYPTGSSGGGLSFCSLRPNRAYGHVHVAEGPEARQRVMTMLSLMVDALPPTTHLLDVGITGVSHTSERWLSDHLRTVPGSTVLERSGMERDILPEDTRESPRTPSGLHQVSIRSLRLDELTELDWTAFRGTADESLIGDSSVDTRRVLEEILAGRLGRFLDEASTALVDDLGRVWGAILTAEQSPRQAIFLDLMVDPSQRRRGHATFLLRWALRALWALGYGSVRLWVTEANTPAMHLYDRLGFRPSVTAIIYRWTRRKDANDAS